MTEFKLSALNWEDPLSVPTIFELISIASTDHKNRLETINRRGKEELEACVELFNKNHELNSNWDSWDPAVREKLSKRQGELFNLRQKISTLPVIQPSKQFDKKIRIGPVVQPQPLVLEQASALYPLTQFKNHTAPSKMQHYTTQVYPPFYTTHPNFAKKKVYIYQKDFPHLPEELGRLSNEYEYFEWQPQTAVPNDGPLLHFEDVVTRLDDQYLPEMIKSLNSKWGGRYALVPLFKQGSSAMDNFNNTEYESKIVPGVVVMKGVYAGKMSNDGINSGYQKVVTKLMLKDLVAQL